MKNSYADQIFQHSFQSHTALPLWEACEEEVEEEQTNRIGKKRLKRPNHWKDTPRLKNA